ncbi:MAG: MarR family winged helix-turn-helix transcriptional regulator [Lachnospiraceae bacterium]
MEKNINDVPLTVLMHKLLHMMKQQAAPLFKSIDLKTGGAGILFTLAKYGPMSQRELADKVGITPPSMTVALRKLENEGYINRRPDQNDQRIIRIEMQDKGNKCLASIRQAMKEVEGNMFVGFTQEERILLRRFLIQMYYNLLNSGECSEEELSREIGCI